MGSVGLVVYLVALQSSAPKLKTFVEPEYPEEARHQSIGGTVTLHLQVDIAGRVTDAHVESGIHPALDAAAVVAARRLEFEPAREQGQPVAREVTFEYRFTPPGHTHAAPARESEPIVATEVETVTVVQSVEDERPLTAASARTVRQRDLRLRPILSPGDLARVAPGLIPVQHAGGGKATQYLLRGFDADHGTDVALSFDGVPVNMVSHGHGQGYSDINFVIPELVQRVEVSKGPYFVENGDFATAGAIDFITRSRGESFASVGGGSFDTVRAVAIAAPEAGKWHPLFAGELVHTDGPFENPERFAKYNLFGKLTYDLDSRSTLSLAASTYVGTWNASGQLPVRAVRSGLVGFYGSLDPSEGGQTSRQNVYATYRLRPDRTSEFQSLVYHTAYAFRLYSNFTFVSRDPVNGDQIEQSDRRTMTGARTRYRWLRQWGGVLFDSSVGGDARVDHIDNGLSYARERQRLQKVVDANIGETSVGLFAKEEVQFVPWLRVVGGMRADHFAFRVDDRLGPDSGIRGASRVSPKGAVIVSPHASTDLFLDFGYGFHSNDARGVVRAVDPVSPLTRVVGYEVGARMRLFDRRLEVATSLWALDMESETVWVGDEGTTEAAGATRRLGVELEARVELLPWLFFDADLTFSDARFRENAGAGQSVALAPRFTAAGGLSVLHRTGVRGGLRGLHVARRPATEDEFLMADAMTLFELFAAYRWRSVELNLAIENLLDRRTRSAQFATVTRLPAETDCPRGTRTTTGGCEDLSFSPANPFGLRLMATTYF